MKHAVQTATLESEGLAEQTEFRVNTNSSKLFDILQNSLYTDKVLAPVREYICNAYDAHLEAKNPRPFDAYVPNKNVPEWVVRDYGLGLSKSQVMGLFTTYLMSSKDDSDDLIGGFGIGSKSAFAYTDQFSVVSYQAGTATRYACYINAARLPEISIVNEEPTDEPDGLMIRVPVRSDTVELQLFAVKTSEVLQHFPEGSFVAHGVFVKPAEYDERTPQYGIINRNGWETLSHKLIMGNVAYAIPPSITSEPLFQALQHNRKEITIFANIGDCSISPSRETLSLDRKSEAWLKKKCADLLTELSAEANKILGATTNAVEYARAASKMENSAAGAFIPHVSAAPYKFKHHYMIPVLEHYPDLQIYYLRGPSGGPPRNVTNARNTGVDWTIIPPQCVICTPPHDGKIIVALKNAYDDIVAFLGNSRRFKLNGAGPFAIVGTAAQLAAHGLTPDYDLTKYQDPPKPKSGGGQKYVYPLLSKTKRYLLANLPEDAVVVAPHEVLEAEKALKKLHNNFLAPTIEIPKQMFVEVPKAHTKLVTQFEKYTSFKDKIARELWDNREIFFADFFANTLRSFNTTYEFIEKVVQPTNKFPPKEPKLFYNFTTIQAECQGTFMEQTLLDIVAEYHKLYDPVLDEIKQKLDDNTVPYKIASAFFNDDEVMDFVRMHIK